MVEASNTAFSKGLIEFVEEEFKRAMQKKRCLAEVAKAVTESLKEKDGDSWVCIIYRENANGFCYTFDDMAIKIWFNDEDENYCVVIACSSFM